MRTNWGLTAVAGGLAMIGGFIAGCQTYDFEPVEPLFLGVERKEIEVSARAAPPNLMILLDKSDSMDRPEDPSLAACQTGNPSAPVCGTGAAPRCQENLCPTRLSRLREAMAGFLATEADGTYPFRVGLTAFPYNGQCSPSDANAQFVPFPSSEDGAALGANATDVNTWVQTLLAEDGTSGNFGDKETAGGTPTAASLRFLREKVDALQDQANGRQNFVLLLTDGLPNCNSQHPLTNACQCVLADPTQCFPSATSPGAPDGCLDDVSTVGAITELLGDKVKTIVVGLGSETASGLGPETLNAMGHAGGFTRSCSHDDECGENDSCNASTKVCENGFYQASNGAALGEALRNIARLLPGVNPCQLNFSNAPSEDDLIFVKVDGKVLPATEGGTTNWTFDAATKVFNFEGPVCEKIMDSTPANPVSVDVSVVQSR